MPVNNKSLNDQAEQILELAERRGVQNNFFFRTTFQRYLMQLQIMEGLQKAIQKAGMTTERTYVKGTSNTYANPAIKELNNTINSANGTVKTLIKITESFGTDDDGAAELMRFINGEDDDEDE